MTVPQPFQYQGSKRLLARDRTVDHVRHYYSVRDRFNRTNDPRLLLYLLARCVKSSVRYNDDGHFNQSPDKRRLGTTPARMRDNVMAVSMLLNGTSTFTAWDYREVLESVRGDDVVYMDPPYQGVSGTRDHRYLLGTCFDDFCAGLDLLNTRGIKYAVSYDGRAGGTAYGRTLPDSLDLVRLEIEAGRSSQATLLGRNAITVESLYLSQRLAEEVRLPGAGPRVA